MLRRTMSRIAVALLAAVIAAGTLEAQTGSGVIRGTVQDASNAAIPKAKVALRNQNTNISRETAVSSVGLYYFGEIPPGNYELIVEADGFKKWIGTLKL